MKKKLTMQEILDKFPECDSFSLAGPLSEKLNSEEKEKIIKEMEEETKEYCLKNCFKEDNGVDFDYVYNYLREFISKQNGKLTTPALERNMIYKLIRNKLESLDQNSYEYKETIRYINDKKFKNDNNDMAYICKLLNICKNFLDLDDFIIGVIQALFMEHENKKNINCDNVKKVKLDTILKDNLIKTKNSFDDGAAIYSFLSTVYYFKLNEETKKWLLQFKTDFDLDVYFNDLVLYKNGEIIFSSVTHERMNTLGEDFYNNYD